MSNQVTLFVRGFPSELQTALNVHCAAHSITRAEALAEALRLLFAVHDDRLIEVDEATQERLAYVLKNAVAPAEVA